MSHPGYPHPYPVKAIVERLREATRGELYEFWADDISLLSERVADAGRIHGPRRITDVYLLGLATRRGGQFVTFDQGVSLSAAVGADKRHLLIL